MDTSIIQEVSKVFGLSLEDTQEFINNMDINAPIPEGYFTALLQKLPKATLVEFPKKPANLPTRRIYPTSQKNYWQKVFKNQRNKYNENMKQYETKLLAYESAEQSNNSIFVNEDINAQGQYGYVKHNKKSPYIYKFLNIEPERMVDSYIKAVLNEPLINCILQQDPIGKPFTCQLFKLYTRPYEGAFQLIFKLEDLKGDVLSETFAGRLGNNREQNLDILVRVFGPLLEALQALRAKYSFEHGDLHGENIMFVNQPNIQEKTNLDIKMIDFGYSSMSFAGKKFGSVKNKHRETYYLIKRAELGVLPTNITLTINQLIQDGEYEEIALLFLDVYKTMKGGKRRQTRKNKKKKNA